MCGGKASAVPNTHTVLRATIIVDTPATSATTSRSSSTPSTTSDSSTSTTADSSTSTSSTASETTSDIASTSEGDVVAPTAPASAEDSSPVPVAGTKLSSPQLAGIVVASVGAAVLAIAAIAVAACMRRRRRRSRERDSDTNSLPFQNEPSRDEKYFRNGLGNGSVGPMGPKKTPPARFPLEYGDPGISLPTDLIGVAVSPETKKYIMPTSGLPEKPKLRLYVPPEPVAKDGPLPGQIRMPRNKNEYYDQGEPSRDSAMTQFEEDNTPYTPFSYEENNTTYYGLPNGEEKPSQPTIIPTTQQGASASQAGLRPQDIRKPAKSFSQPLQPATATSSVYSGRSSPRDSTANYQNGRQPQQSPYRAYTPYRQPSQSEAAELPTEYNNQGPWPSETPLVPAPLRRKSHVNDRRSADLSPVVESPVSYPKIPKLSPTFAYPPPKQPNFQRLQNPRTSAGSGMSADSTSSSLLEKRRGKEQADALVLGRVDKKASAGGKNAWRVVPGSGGNGGNETGWKPQQNGSGRSFMNLQGERGQVPMSPSPWELTPKKMGDDLFLTVR
ncbi:hypothetical protein V495_02340 [Pseudogymnoascus sp. VKM F-4514 (FW-929)]|nr:hypothetical protein V495_02340 [Pseudogymnoascus sp. VKM F-4514 (FW-929)]KFY65975.1 hypothetical protein V497_01164 [Pseudogymnoascus sp. VKM F-4516 (FW-969)]